MPYTTSCSKKDFRDRHRKLQQMENETVRHEIERARTLDMNAGRALHPPGPFVYENQRIVKILELSRLSDLF